MRYVVKLLLIVSSLLLILLSFYLCLVIFVHGMLAFSMYQLYKNEYKHEVAAKICEGEITKVDYSYREWGWVKVYCCERWYFIGFDSEVILGFPINIGDRFIKGANSATVEIVKKDGRKKEGKLVECPIINVGDIFHDEGRCKLLICIF